MHVTVAICTWNRSALLRSTLERMTALHVPAGLEWELIVVNNNSTDDTDAVIAAFAGRLPIRGVVETKQGHSNARNRAVAEARGDLLIWTDDDVLVDAEWLAAYAAAAREHADVDFFAGPVKPWFEVTPPGWMLRHLEGLSGVLVSVDHGREKRLLKLGEPVFGASMAVRLAVARAFPFSPNFGRVKDTLTGGDDTNFLQRVIGAGHKALWLPTAIVDHFVPKGRLTEDYVRRWFRDSGRIVARGLEDAGTAAAGRVPRWVWKRYAVETAKAWFWSPTRNARWFTSYRQALLLRGVILELKTPRANAA